MKRYGYMAGRYVVIMAGGKGDRFWPASRLKRPKHLLPIVGDKPMLTQTVDRLKGFIDPSCIYVITNSEQLEGVRDVCPMLPEENVVAEPVGRDTAAVVLVVLQLYAMPMAISCTCTNRFLNDGINSPTFLYPKIGYASF